MKPTVTFGRLHAHTDAPRRATTTMHHLARVPCYDRATPSSPLPTTNRRVDARSSRVHRRGGGVFICAAFRPGSMPLDDARRAAVDAAMEETESFGRITLTGPPKSGGDGFKRVEFRWVSIRGRSALQRARFDARQSFTSNHGRRGEETGIGKKGKDGDCVEACAEDALEEALGMGFRHWRVETASGAWNVVVNAKKNRTTVSRDKTFGAGDGLIDGTTKTMKVVVGAQAHDRQKARIISGDDPFLKYVGVAAEDGSVKASKRDKYKQVEEFLKILNHAYDEATSAQHMSAGSTERPLRVCDLGCGNAYLTFGAFSLLTNKREVPTRVVGVDVKRQARERNTHVAKELGWENSMRFIEGTIADANVDFDLANAADAAADVVLALHACDTATDESIVRTIRWRSSLALIAPCCHHNLQMRLKKSPKVAFPPMARHGILSERLGDVLTDSFRAHIFRLLGYRVDVMEFVGGEHTPRNTLIRAIRTGSPASKQAWDEYDDMCEAWGVVPFLADELREELGAARAGTYSY